MSAGRFREAFVRHVGGRHASLAAAAARAIAGFLLNRATDDDLLDAAGAVLIIKCQHSCYV